MSRSSTVSSGVNGRIEPIVKWFVTYGTAHLYTPEQTVFSPIFRTLNAIVSLTQIQFGNSAKWSR